MAQQEFKHDQASLKRLSIKNIYIKVALNFLQLG